MKYIEFFNIDVNNLYSLEDTRNELLDKVFFQLNIDLIDDLENIGQLEEHNPYLINPLLVKLDELERKILMDCMFGQRKLLEKDLEKNIDVIVKLLNIVGINIPC